MAHSLNLPGRGNRLVLLRSIELDVMPGESVAIVGRSGSGKSTLLSALGLLRPLQAGQIDVAGVRTDSLSDRQRAKVRNQHVGFVFQSYSLIGHLTAMANVELPLRYWTAASRRNRRGQAAAMLDAVGLSDRARSRPKQLSGGEQQRVAIARALVRSPAVVLADEPTGALDEQTANDVLDAMFHAVHHRGCALVVVTHDPVVAQRVDRRLRLDGGFLIGEEP